MDNKDLKTLYNDKYKSGKQNFFTFTSFNESLKIASLDNWKDKKVLEIGCGEGDLASILACGEAKVKAIDYSEESIEIARKKYHIPNLEFFSINYEDFDRNEKFDIIIMQGVLEHMDNPLDTLKRISGDLLNRPGKIITSSPGFLNPRGYIWMTLHLLFDIKVSLTDLHFLFPYDFEEWAKQLNAKLSYISVDQDWGHGDRLIIDFNKRLRNAFRDKGITADIDKYLKWLSKTLKYTTYTDFSGANIIYQLEFE